MPGCPGREKEDTLKGQLCDCSCFALGIDTREATGTASVTWASSLVLAVAWPGTVIWFTAPYSYGFLTSASPSEASQSLDFDYSGVLIIKMYFIIKKPMFM